MPSIEFTDTHCHIHEAGGKLSGDEYASAQKWAKAGVTNPGELAKEAAAVGVNRLICVGTTLADSELAVDFVQKQPNCWASIGIHPHEAKDYSGQTGKMQKFRDLLAKPKVVAIGECGLDYFYDHSPKTDQIEILEFQLNLAQEHNLPLIFHIRDAFADFWPIFDQFEGLRGVVHSFSSDRHDLDQVLTRGLYVGLNGIMTFTKNSEQLLAAKAIPLQKLLLETDAPYLTPAPHRGTICQPKHVSVTAEFLAGLRDENLAILAQTTTQNACNLFGVA